MYTSLCIQICIHTWCSVLPQILVDSNIAKEITVTPSCVKCPNKCNRCLQAWVIFMRFLPNCRQVVRKLYESGFSEKFSHLVAQFEKRNQQNTITAICNFNQQKLHRTLNLWVDIKLLIVGICKHCLCEGDIIWHEMDAWSPSLLLCQFAMSERPGDEHSTIPVHISAQVDYKLYPYSLPFLWPREEATWWYIWTCKRKLCLENWQ